MVGGYRDRERPSECGHDQTVLVSPANGGRSARCLACGTIGPVRETSEEARRTSGTSSCSRGATVRATSPCLKHFG